MTSQFVDMTSLLIFFDVVMFLLSGLVTGLRNVSNKMLLNAAKCQGYIFYRFSVIKEKPTRGVNLSHPQPTQIRFKAPWISI